MDSKALWAVSGGSKCGGGGGGVAVNAKVSHGGRIASLVNMPQGGEHCFQELSYWGLKVMSSVGDVCLFK